jgi:hypothetical protein
MFSFFSLFSFSFGHGMEQGAGAYWEATGSSSIGLADAYLLYSFTLADSPV